MGLFPLAAAWIWFGSIALAMAIGRRRGTAVESALATLLFGPLGVLYALGVDNRPTCSVCGTRLNGEPLLCPGCHNEIEWLGSVFLMGRRAATRHAPAVRSRP